MPDNGDTRGAPEGFLWSDAKRIFGEALEHSPEQRSEYLARACGADSELYREVVSLLENHGSADSFFESTIAATVDPMIGARRVGLYKILRQIGLGGMGTVYLAERAERSVPEARSVEGGTSGAIQ